MALTPVISAIPLRFETDSPDSQTNQHQPLSFTCPTAQSIKGFKIPFDTSITNPGGTWAEDTRMQVMIGGTRGLLDGTVVAEIDETMAKGGFIPVDIALGTNDVVTLIPVLSNQDISPAVISMFTDTASDWRLAKDYFESGSRLTWSVPPTYDAVVQAPYMREIEFTSIADDTPITASVAGMQQGALARMWFKAAEDHGFGFRDSVSGDTLDFQFALAESLKDMEVRFNGSVLGQLNDSGDFNANQWKHLYFGFWDGMVIGGQSELNSTQQRQGIIANINLTGFTPDQVYIIQRTGGAATVGITLLEIL